MDVEPLWRVPAVDADGAARRAWLRRLYREVAALLRRYPNLAGRVRTGWWARAAERELLALLCADRQALDLDAIAQSTASKQLDREYVFLLRLPAVGDFLARQAPADAFHADHDADAFRTWLDAANDPILQPHGAPQ